MVMTTTAEEKRKRETPAEKEKTKEVLTGEEKEEKGRRLIKGGGGVEDCSEGGEERKRFPAEEKGSERGGDAVGMLAAVGGAAGGDPVAVSSRDPEPERLWLSGDVITRADGGTGVIGGCGVEKEAVVESLVTGGAVVAAGKLGGGAAEMVALDIKACLRRKALMVIRARVFGCMRPKQIEQNLTEPKPDQTKNPIQTGDQLSQTENPTQTKSNPIQTETLN